MLNEAMEEEEHYREKKRLDKEKNAELRRAARRYRVNPYQFYSDFINTVKSPVKRD